MSTVKHTLCNVCDGYCPLKVEVEDNKIISIEGDPVMCYKPLYWNEYMNHPMRITSPMKNTGKKGEQNWEKISWDQALDEIADKLTAIIDKYGPESFSLSTLADNAGSNQGLVRRFMNLIGSPNYITGLHMCLGNTIQVHRATMGTSVEGDYSHTDCIVLLGHNPHKNNWINEYTALKEATDRGAKLIVIDPRLSENAQIADLHLPIRYGTDAALLLGWLNVIIEEELYDKEIVENWTVGFDELKKRVRQYPVDKVAEITQCSKELIIESARLYAKSHKSIIPWGPIPDMQYNGTSVIRCQDILRTICGFLNVSETLLYPNPDILYSSDIEMHENLPEDKKALQLGTEDYPLFTYTGLDKLKEPSKRVYGMEYMNLAASFMANPPAVFRAMRTGMPYPVKAFFAFGSNALMGYANQQGIFDGLMNQELIVAFDHIMTPTAQLADYFLPGDYYLERPGLMNTDDFPTIGISQQMVEPAGECKNQYYVIKGLADRMGMGEYFPWKDFTELMEYRIKGTGSDWKEYEKEAGYDPSREVDPFTSGDGFATPSGKIELYSSLFEDLGYDPLPYYEEPPQTHISSPKLAEEYPLTVFVGVREAPFYLTNLRHIDPLRKRLPYPELFIHPDDCKSYNVEENMWVWVETTHGKMKLKVKSDVKQPAGTLRVPHGWWMPELEPGLETGLSGAMIYNDGMILSDESWNLDKEQGIPNFRGGILAKVYPA